MRLTALTKCIRPFPLLFLLAAGLRPIPALAQPAASPLAGLYQKASLTPADLKLLGNRVTDIAKSFTDTVSKVSSNDRDRETARRRVLDELMQGTPAFRAAAAAAFAAESMTYVSGVNLHAAVGTLLVLNELHQPTTRPALLAGLNNMSLSGARYLGARGLRELQGQLTAPDDYEPVIEALSEAAKFEFNPLVLKTLYEALDFSVRQPNFRGQVKVATALAKIFEVHMTRSAYSPREDLAGIELAGRIGPSLEIVVPLAETLHQLLLIAMENARIDPTGSDVPLLGQIEEALHKVVDKHTPDAAGVPRMAAAFSNGKVDAAKLYAARDALVGPSERPGALNAAPWRLKAQ